MSEKNNLPEAGGVAWANVYSRTGVKINLTARAEDTIAALDALFKTIEYAIKEKGCTAFLNQQASKAPQPADSPAVIEAQLKPEMPQAKRVVAEAENGEQAPAEEKVRFQVEKIAAKMTDSGKNMFKIYGDRWSKFGVTCWPETLANIYETEASSSVPNGYPKSR